MSIHIKKRNKGKFTASAKEHGQGVQEYAHKVMNNPKASGLQKKRANFAIQAKKWHHGQSGVSILPEQLEEKQLNREVATLNGLFPSQPQLPNVQLSTLPGNTVPDTLSIPQAPQMLNYTGKRRKGTQQIDWGNVATAGLLAIDAAIPPEPIQYPVVRPGLSYNEHPYGTGSQAIAQNGVSIASTKYAMSPLSASKDRKFLDWYKANTIEGNSNIPFSDKLDYDYYSYYKNGDYKEYKGGHFPDTYKRPNHPTFSNESIYSVPENPGGHWKGNKFIPHAESGITLSTEGYKSNSPDRKKKMLRIPSNKITMKNVPHPVLGIDNQGNTQYMTPGNEYEFQGDYVDEIPMAQNGSKPIYTSNPNDPRLKAYNDSLTLYNSTKNELNDFTKLKSAHEQAQVLKDWEQKWGKTANPAYSRLTKLNGTSPTLINQVSKNFPDGWASTGQYKKPVQPVVYQKPQQQNKPTYNDSLTVYNYVQQYNDLVKKHSNYTTPEDIQKGFDETIKFQNTPFAKKAIALSNSGNYDIQNKPYSNKTSQGLSSIIDLGYFKKPVGIPIPQRQKGALEDFSLPVYDMSTGTRPVPGGGVNIPTSQLTSPTPTKYAFAYPDENGRQKNVYFKNKGDLQNFMKGTRGTSTQEGQDYMTGTGYLKSGGTLSSAKAKEMLRDGTANGKKLTDKQKRYFGYISGGGKAENGVTILDENTIKFTGDKHSDPSGGIPIAYGGKNVMVEGDETGYLSPVDNSLTVMGNLKNPLTGRKFKNDSKILADKEAKMNELMDRGFELIDNNKPLGKWESLKFNAGKVMMSGAAQKKKELMSSKEHLKALQQAMLDTSYESGIEPQHLSEGKYGATMQDGGTLGLHYRQIRNKKPKQSLAQRHNNPGNIMYSDWEQEFGAEKGEARYDKSGKLIGYFAKFPSIEQGQAAMKQLLTGKGYNNLTVEAASKKWTGEGAYKNIPSEIRNLKIKDLSPEQLNSALDTFTLGEDSKHYNWNNTKNPTPQIPYDGGRMNWQDVTDVPASHEITRGGNNDYNFNFTQPTPYNLPSNAQPLEFEQILPELYTAATNKVEPVFMQKYQPELYEPYQISLQDKLNENQATFSALQKASAYNPSALATLAGQKYSADSSVLGDEFRINQGIANDITNKNIQLINDAELKNLGLADTQYTRQSQARSNAKAINHQVLNSISAKMLENEATNRRLQVYENLYNFRYDPNNNMKANYLGPSGTEYIDWNGEGSDTGGLSQNQSMKQFYNKNGQLTSTSINTPSLTKQILDEYNLRDKTSAMPNVNKELKSSLSKSFRDYFRK